MHARVVVPDHGVVVAACLLDLVFDLGERPLQLREVLGGAQLRVVLGDREDGAQRLGQQVLRLRLFHRPLRGDRLGAQLGDALQHLPLVAHVASHRLDQVGNQVIAALELSVDVSPGGIGAYPQRRQPVVENDHQGGGRHEGDNEYEIVHADSSGDSIRRALGKMRGAGNLGKCRVPRP